MYLLVWLGVVYHHDVVSKFFSFILCLVFVMLLFLIVTLVFSLLCALVDCERLDHSLHNDSTPSVPIYLCSFDLTRFFK